MIRWKMVINVILLCQSNTSYESWFSLYTTCITIFVLSYGPYDTLGVSRWYVSSICLAMTGNNMMVCWCFRISYLDIFKVVELTCEKHQDELVTAPSLEEIVHYDLWARDYAATLKPLTSGVTPALVWRTYWDEGVRCWFRLEFCDGMNKCVCLEEYLKLKSETKFTKLFD